MKMTLPAALPTLLASLALCAGSARAQDDAQANQQATQPAGQPATMPARPAAQHQQNGQAQMNTTNQQPEAKALLEKSRDAIAAAKTLEYDISAPQIGLMGGDRAPKNVKAHVIMSRNDAGQWVMRIKGNAMIGKDASPTPFDVVWDQRAVTWVDDQAKTVYTRPFGGAKGLRNVLQVINGLRVPNITGDRPLAEELSQSTIVLNGTDDVGGVTCDVVIAGSTTEGNGNRKKIWIAKSDSLPRKLENIIESKLINASTVIEFSDVKVNQTIPPERIAIATPEGYAVDKAEPAQPKAVKLDHLAVPEFELATLEGAKVSKSSLSGGVAVIQFWGTWSNPSKRSHPELQALAESYKDKGVKFFIASVREKDPEAVKAYLKEAGINIPVLLEADTLIEQLDIQTVPAAVVMGADGANVKVVPGFLKETTMKEIGDGIESALKDAAAKKAETTGDKPAEPAPAATK